MQYNEQEREIDLKQLFLITCTRWKFLLLCAVLGIMAAVLLNFTRGGEETAAETGQEAASASTAQTGETTDASQEGDSKYDYNAEVQKYLTEKEYYDRMQALYAQWIDEAQSTLEEGMPDTLPEDTTRIEETQRALSIVAQIDALKKARDAMTEPKMPERYQVKIEPETENITVTEISQTNRGNLVRNAGIGFFGGLFVAFLLSFLYDIFGGRFLSAEELKSRYGLRMIGMASPAKGKGPGKLLTRFGADRVYLSLSEKERLEVLKSNLSVYAGEEKELMLTGSVGNEEMEALAARLREGCPELSFRTAPNLLSNVASLQHLQDVKNVILTERAGQSVYRDVDREMQLLHDRGIGVIGTIVLSA